MSWPFWHCQVARTLSQPQWRDWHRSSTRRSVGGLLHAALLAEPPSSLTWVVTTNCSGPSCLCSCPPHSSWRDPFTNSASPRSGSPSPSCFLFNCDFSSLALSPSPPAHQPPPCSWNIPGSTHLQDLHSLEHSSPKELMTNSLTSFKCLLKCHFQEVCLDYPI